MAAHDEAEDMAPLYSSREARLRQGVPSRLQNAGHARHNFDHARDPFISAQRKDLEKAEGQRREEGDGSKMVKLYKPFPELRPKHDLSQIRGNFNKSWLSEYRSAQMKQFEAQEQHFGSEKTQDHKARFPKYERGR